MTRNRLSPSRRREDIRAWWAEHLQAQRKSGETQVAYCRAKGLDAKYFTLWKRKLKETTPRLVPVVISSRPKAAVGRAVGVHSSSAPIAVRVSLAGGVSLSLEITTAALPALVQELVRLGC